MFTIERVKNACDKERTSLDGKNKTVWKRQEPLYLQMNGLKYIGKLASIYKSRQKLFYRDFITLF